MALNLHDTLDILKRAGLGPDDTIKPSDTEQRLQERLQRLQRNPQYEQEHPNFSFRGSRQDQTRASVERHRDPESLPLHELLNIDDL